MLRLAHSFTMDIYMMIRRQKTTIFTDAKENTSVMELKRILEGILKVSPENQKLFKDETEMEDTKTLQDCGLTSSTAQAHKPATLVLCFRQEDGEFEAPEVVPYSTPPELPDVMRPQQETAPAEQIAS
ncbi:Elongin-B [Amphibalanus amphitrite]|uniref:Elongin-B n=2 Tax=Amphibalanus amphitrite TaxID=1232801 RepID=A0A6A4XAZ8_AMPAM|nr:Elongin-B [Amphibalanus amphitrite]